MPSKTSSGIALKELVLLLAFLALCGVVGWQSLKVLGGMSDQAAIATAGVIAAIVTAAAGVIRGRKGNGQ